MLDDFHRIENDAEIHETILKIIDGRKEKEKHTVIASRRKPMNIFGLSKNLRWCIESGYVVKIDSPGTTERLAMLKIIQQRRKLNEMLDDEILCLIAEKTDGKNMDELDDFLNTYLIRMIKRDCDDYSSNNDMCDKIDCINTLLKDEFNNYYNSFMGNIDNMARQTIMYKK